MAHAPRRWRIGRAPDGLAREDGVVALVVDDLTEADAASAAIAFHDAMLGPVTPAREGVDVFVPGYRGSGLIAVLAWLAGARLSRPGATVAWHLDKRQGPDKVHRLLTGLGWRLEKTRAGRITQLVGQAPEVTPQPPPPQSFEADIGAQRVRFAADYGVFSPRGIDDGTRLLLDVALHEPPVDVVADVGVGYGPLAIGLVRNGIARRAVATDVDAVALWLALRNAAEAGVTLTVACSSSPDAVEPAGLTVCNVPTHIDAARSARLMSGLLERARTGRLLMVVHESLENRYLRHIAHAGLSATVERGPTHVVLGVAG